MADGEWRSKGVLNSLYREKNMYIVKKLALSGAGVVKGGVIKGFYCMYRKCV